MFDMFKMTKNGLHGSFWAQLTASQGYFDSNLVNLDTINTRGGGNKHNYYISGEHQIRSGWYREHQIRSEADRNEALSETTELTDTVYKIPSVVKL